jgi:hypothetical protein
MILWQSLYVEINGNTHVRPAPAPTMINTNGRWLISKWMPRRMWRPPMIIYPIPVGLVSHAAGRPRWTGVDGDKLRRRGSGEHHRQRQRLGRTFLLY